MPAFQLGLRRVEKPWGRRRLGAGFEAVPEDAAPIGEIIFESPRGGPDTLLLKYLFTSEKLSIQVHPDDAAARARGLPNGKDEAWLVLEAEPGATLGVGLAAPATREELRAAALDGSIEALVDWRGVQAGDSLYSPAGTIHAIGPGLSLVEVQQNSDTTYRLYDYGRPRELHLDEGLAAARTELKPATQPPAPLGDGRTRLAWGPAFQMERLEGPAQGLLAAPADGLWVLALEGGGDLDGQALTAPSAWVVVGEAALNLDQGASLLLAYPGPETLGVWRSRPTA